MKKPKDVRVVIFRSTVGFDNYYQGIPCVLVRALCKMSNGSIAHCQYALNEHALQRCDTPRATALRPARDLVLTQLEACIIKQGEYYGRHRVGSR